MHAITHRRLSGTLLALALGAISPLLAQTPSSPAAAVNPLIGSRNGGNTFPGAVLPFGMLAWSPENTRGKHDRTAAPGGYQYDATRIRGFSLTHLSGTGCAGASGDIPFMPVTVPITSSPSADADDSRYASDFSHPDEHAAAGDYQVTLANGVAVELSAATRSGIGSFAFPAGQPANLLIRSADSEVGSSAAQARVDRAARTVSGSVTSGNFCGYLSKADRRSYYTLYFVAQFDQPILGGGSWQDGKLNPDSTSATGGTGYGAKGFPPIGKGSGVWLNFAPGSTLGVRVGISYVSAANAQANLDAEIPHDTSLAQVRQAATAAWDQALGHIAIDGGSADQRSSFYTALYHVMAHPNIYSDVNGQYTGFDQRVHQLEPDQQAQYANFSGWDIYRSHLQLVTWLYPQVGSDIAQSLYNQAKQNGGEWDRWTHNAGGTHVMSGDPSAPALADIVAFGGSGFDLAGAYDSLYRAATVPTAHDLSDEGCNVECVGQRPSLDQWLSLHYIAAHSHAWGGAGETLEDASADFALSELAGRLNRPAQQRELLARAGYWRNLYNPKATPTQGYIQNRNADGSWPAFTPDTDEGFVEGSAAVYLWMVPFDVQGLFDTLGGTDSARARLDTFFHQPDGRWALTKAGPLHAELDNEPSIATPWLYDFAGQPWQTQAALRQVLDTLWSNTPAGIPGNDDLGEMSSWYVWTALGLYPEIPGRAELLVGSPLFPRARIASAGRELRIEAPNASTQNLYVRGLHLNGQSYARPWLPASVIAHGGELQFDMATTPDPHWGSAATDAPPSFAPPKG